MIKVKKSIPIDDLGFCFDEDDDDEGDNNFLFESDKENEVEAKQLNLENKFLKEDLAQLSSLCSDIVQLSHSQQKI